MPADDLNSNLPLVFVITEDIGLYQHISVRLSAQNCKAVLINDNKKQNLEKQQTSDFNRFISFISKETFEAKYIIFIIGENEKLQSKDQQVQTIVKASQGRNVKILVVLPFNQYEHKKDYFANWERLFLKESGIYAGVVYSGEVLVVGSTLNNLFDNNKIILPESPAIFYPITYKNLTDFLVASLFSMRAYKVCSAILGKPLMQQKLVEQINLKRVLNTLYTPNRILKSENVHQTTYIQTDEEKLLSEFFDSVLNRKKDDEGSGRMFLKNMATKIKVSKIIYMRSFLKRDFLSVKEKTRNLLFSLKGAINFSNWKPNLNKALDKNSYKMQKEKRGVIPKVLFLLIISFIFLPLLLLIFAAGTLGISRRFMASGMNNPATELLSISNFSVANAKNYSLYFIDKNIAPNYFRAYYQKANYYESVISVESKLINIMNYLAFDNKNLENYQPIPNYREIAIELEILYKDLGFLQSEFGMESFNNAFMAQFFGSLSTSEVREKIILTSILLKEGDSLFGIQKPVSYLIVLQDSDLLRATGGKIKELAIITLANGEIIEKQFYSVESADSKFIGHVDSPEPLKKYFGTNKWLMAESNWSIDYPTSAQKAEWFLDKELDLQVDGVVALTDKVLDSLLLATDNSTISTEDGETMQLEQLLDFASSADQLTTTRKLVQFANTKDVLFFLHNAKVKDVLNSLGWDGSLSRKNCSDKCYTDLIGVSEASVEGGSSNIIRETIVSISFEENLIKREITHFIENKNSEDYKSYIRFVVNSDSGISPVRIITNNNEEEKNLEIYGAAGNKEAGIFILVPAGETVALNFRSESGTNFLKNLGEYKLMAVKQSGIEEYPLEVRIKQAENFEISPRTIPSLTDNNIFIYNTKLVHDYLINLELN